MWLTWPMLGRLPQPAGVVAADVTILADAGMVTVGVADLADAGMAFPADLAGVVAADVTTLGGHRRCV